MLLFPTGHDSLEGRRWPYVTIAVIILNAIAFAASYNSINRDSEELWVTKLRILMLEADHGYVEKTPEVQQMIDEFKSGQPKLWARIDDPQRPPQDMWDIEMREFEPAKAQAEMDALSEQFVAQRANSVLEKYAFYSNKKEWHRYITASFLHGGWFHIIFNMWFLWLAGTVIEDSWGRAIYAAFYVLGAYAALFAHTMGSPNSVIPTIGASGAVAALMGAFLVRFATTKINFVLAMWFGFRPYFWKFKLPAFVMLPLWLATQLFWAMMLSGVEGGGVAYWAHIGGFAFGVVGALAMKFSGLEHKVSKSIDDEVGWSADDRLVKAGELMALRTDEAIAELNSLLAEKPNDIDALKLLVSAHWKKQDMPAHNAALAQLLSAQVKAKQMDAALDTLDEATHHGLLDSSSPATGHLPPATDFMSLCRHLESQQNFERAAAEYERYAQLFPADRMSVYALVAAARLQLKQLGNRSEAARLYRAAQASPVPHLDWDDAIARGLRDAESAPQPVAAQ